MSLYLITLQVLESWQVGYDKETKRPLTEHAISFRPVGRTEARTAEAALTFAKARWGRAVAVEPVKEPLQ